MWFGQYVFLILISDLNTILTTLKFVDNVTLTELIDQPNTSRMQVEADQIADKSHQNFMNMKTTEVQFGRITKIPPPQVTFNTGAVDQVTSFKLFGIIISDNLSWENHVNAVCETAGTHLHILKLHQWPYDDFLHYYKSITRPVIEYACPVWQSGLMIDQRGINGLWTKLYFMRHFNYQH